MKLTLKVAAAAVAALSITATSACSSSSEPEGEASAASTLTVWHNSADSPAIKNLYKGFEEASGIKVELVSIPSDGFENQTLTKWATGDRPDILEYHPTVSNLLALNPAVNMQELTSQPYVAKSGDLYKTAGSIDGKVYAAITGFPSIFGIYYNKKVLASADAEPPTSFADLPSLCGKLKSSGVAPIFESGGSAWPTQILPLMYMSESNTDNSYGQSLASNQAKLNDPSGAFVASLADYQKLGKDGCFNSDATSATFENGLKAVYSGKAAMTALHSDVYASLLAEAGGDAKKLSDTVGFVPISATKPVGAYAGGPLGTYYAPKTKDAAREAAALKFIEYATGDGYQKLVDEAKTFPVIEGVKTPAGFTELQNSYKSTYEQSTLAVNSNIAGFGGFATETSKLLAGQTDPQAAADSMQTQVEQASKAAGVPGW